MSRVSILEQLRADKRKTALEFDYGKLWAPPIMSLFTPMDIEELRRIATSVRYAGNIAKKYDMIDAVMRKRGFRRAHCGTNRVVYRFLEDASFVAKVAVDSVGMTDSPAEYRNQAYFQPFCCRIFEVDPSGVIAFIERVNPISSIEEFMSVKDDIFNMMITKIIGKYIVDDLGTKAFMNFGIRMNSNGTAFGPVIIDFPYAYELDGAKLICHHKTINQLTGQLEPCGGEIDYDAGFNRLICNRCNREYRAMDLAKESNDDVRFEYTDADKAFAKKIKYMLRARIIDDGKTIYDSGRSSNRIVSKEELEDMSTMQLPTGEFEVEKTYKKKKQNMQQVRQKYYTDLQVQYYNNLASKGVVNPVVNTEVEEEEVDIEINRTSGSADTYNTESSEELMYDAYRKPEDSKTLEILGTVRDGCIELEAEIDVLEGKAFPELENKKPKKTTTKKTTAKKTKKTEPKVEEEPKKEEENVDATIVAEENLPTQVVSDEVVEAMVNEVKAANNTDANNEVVSAIVNPEADAIPENSPFIRPYSDPRNSVHYNPIKDEINGTPVVNLGGINESATEELDNGGNDTINDIILGAINEARETDNKMTDEEFDAIINEEDTKYPKQKAKKSKTKKPKAKDETIEEY